jgi:peptidoglycan/xylan/chitin deacetylase (PgdA/CDA1 family)
MIRVANSIRTKANLPPFTMDGYRNLLHEMKDSGFELRPIYALPDRQENSVYLRHDLDFSAALSTRIAEIEHEAGVSATYFVLLSGPYNPFNEESVAAILRIGSLGHEIGLHYDLTNWPQLRQAAQAKLNAEIQILESLSEIKINSIVMHQPSLGGEDYFATADASWINPTYYQRADASLCYVSDSCRAWRDDTLVKFLKRELPQTRMMLNTHPESWLAEKRMNRISYLEKVLAPAANQSANDYFLKTVKNLWETQPAAVNGFGDEDEN